MKNLTLILAVVFLAGCSFEISRIPEPTQKTAIIRTPENNVITVKVKDIGYSDMRVCIKTVEGTIFITSINNVLITDQTIK